MSDLKFKSINAFDLTGLPHRVVQAVDFNAFGDMSLYALQLAGDHDYPQIFVSTSDLYDVGYTSDEQIDLTNPTLPNLKTIQMNSKSLYDFTGDDFTNHTQTLIISDSMLMTGINYLPYETLEKLLDYAGETPMGFLSDLPDNDSTRDFKNWCNDHSYSNSYILNFGLFKQIGNNLDKLGFFTKVGGFAKALELPDYERIEAAVSSNGRYLLVAGSNTKGSGKNTSETLALNVYYWNTAYEHPDMQDALEKAGSSSALLDRFCSSGYPNDPSKMNQTEIKNALDWFHELFYSDLLVFDINHLKPLSHTIISSDDLVKITAKNPQKPYAFSFQGFAIDDQQNVYLSSGFGPDAKYIIPDNNWLVVIPRGGIAFDKAKVYNLKPLADIMKHHFDSPAFNHLTDIPIECEGIQTIYNDLNELMVFIYMSAHTRNGSNLETLGSWNFLCKL